MDAKEFAEAQGISVQRARELARLGKIDAELIEGKWVIEYDGTYRAPTRRPLSARSQRDVIEYFNTRTLEHATGVRRVRLAAKVRALLSAENPAALLREYFAGSEPPEGPGGAAIVRASLKGFDEQVSEVLRIDRRRMLMNAKSISGAIRDARLIKGYTVDEIVARTGLPRETYLTLEERGIAPKGNLQGWRAINALEISAGALSTPREG